MLDLAPTSQRFISHGGVIGSISSGPKPEKQSGRAGESVVVGFGPVIGALVGVVEAAAQPGMIALDFPKRLGEAADHLPMRPFEIGRRAIIQQLFMNPGSVAHTAAFCLAGRVASSTFFGSCHSRGKCLRCSIQALDTVFLAGRFRRLPFFL